MPDTAANILASSWTQLFPRTGDEADIKSRFNTFARLWHPDVSKDPQASEVFDHLIKARDRALNGPKLQEARFKLSKGSFFSFPYFSKRSWEAGDIFVTDSAMVYRVDPGLADLAHTAQNFKFEFPSDRIRQGIEKHLPILTRTIETETEGKLLIYRRNRNLVPLSDLLDRSGPVDPVHVMWFISSLLNLTSYFYSQGYTHFGLQPEVLLVDAVDHNLALTGPPLYLTKKFAKPSAVPSWVLARYPSLRDKNQKIPYHEVDTFAIRQIAMQALHVHDYVTLKARTDIPEGVKRWLMSAPNPNPIVDYEQWEQLRGTRRFTPYSLTPQQVYDLG